MNQKEAMAKLESLGSQKVLNRASRQGAGPNQFGVENGDIRKIAKEIKTDCKLAEELWLTGNLDARLLSILILKPKELTVDQLESKVEDADFPQLADWLNSYVVNAHPQREEMRVKWFQSPNPAKLRAAWGLTATKIVKDSDGLDVNALLDQIESEMGSAPELVQWTMNFCLAEIGIKFADKRERAVAIGEKLGVYREFHASKGCISPYAPIWISEMVSRQS